MLARVVCMLIGYALGNVLTAELVVRKIYFFCSDGRRSDGEHLVGVYFPP